VIFGLQLKVPTTEKPTVTVNFRKLLLNRCQKEFEKDKDDDEVFEKKQKEMDEAATVRECVASHTLYSHPPSPLPVRSLDPIKGSWGSLSTLGHECLVLDWLSVQMSREGIVAS
jgi:hypothetical protein